MQESTKQAVRTILEASRKLRDITHKLNSDPMHSIISDLSDVVWQLYDIEPFYEDPNLLFFNPINKYYSGEFDVDECLRQLDDFYDQHGSMKER
ncbi:hypothetical protein D3C87_1042730 [compost metagenome]